MDTQARNLRLGDAVYPGKGKEKKHIVALAIAPGSGYVSVDYDDQSTDFLPPGTTRHVLDYERKLPQ